MAAIRDGNQMEFDEKLLIVIDQFEHWLAFNSIDQETQLGNALRHCDGGRIQVLLLIREEFWPSCSRFMEQVEVPLVKGFLNRPLHLPLPQMEAVCFLRPEECASS